MDGMVRYSWKWLDMARTGWKRLEKEGMTGNEWKWLKLSVNDWKLKECL